MNFTQMHFLLVLILPSTKRARASTFTRKNNIALIIQLRVSFEKEEKRLPKNISLRMWRGMGNGVDSRKQQTEHFAEGIIRRFIVFSASTPKFLFAVSLFISFCLLRRFSGRSWMLNEPIVILLFFLSLSPLLRVLIKRLLYIIIVESSTQSADIHFCGIFVKMRLKN